MPTLGEFVRDGLVKAGVIQARGNASAEDQADAIVTFNGMMSELEADGIEVGDFPVSAASTDLDIDREHEQPLKSILAVRLAEDHDLPISNGMQIAAERSMRFLERNTFVRPDVNTDHAPAGRARHSGFDIENG